MSDWMKVSDVWDMLDELDDRFGGATNHKVHLGTVPDLCADTMAAVEIIDVEALQSEKQYIEDGWTAYVDIMLEPEIETLQADNEALRSGLREAMGWNWLDDEAPPKDISIHLTDLIAPQEPGK